MNSPVLVLARKELFTLFNSPATYVVCVLFLVTSGWMFFVPLFVANQSTLDSFLRPLPMLFTFLIPALTMRSFSEEFKAGTIEYLATLPIKDYEIVLGKYLGALGWLVVLMGFTLAYPLILLIIGRPDVGQMIGGYAAILGLGAFFTAIGLWASALTRNQVVAFIVSFFACFTLNLLDRIADFMPGALTGFLKAVSVMSHFDALARGVLDTRDILYWASGSLFFLGGLFGDGEFPEVALMATGKERRKQFAIATTAGVALTGAILIFANVISNWVYLRWDLTASHAYSLSASSKKLVRGLDDPIVIKVYFSNELPAPYNTYARYVKDLLSEYRAASRGKVRYEFVPTQPAQEFERKATEAGLAALQFEEMGSNQLQIKRGFMGLVMFYKDRSETIPVIKGLDNLEYDLTSRMARMAMKQRKVIAPVTGHGETQWAGSQIKLAQDLPSFYDLEKPANLPMGATVPIDAAALLVVGPTQKYDDASLWILDQSIMHGVPVAFLVDSKRFLAQQFMVAPGQSGLGELLKTYGVKLSDQLVYDAQCETVGMTQNLGGMALTTSVRYPYVPFVTDFDKKHPIMRGVDSIGLPFVSPVEAEKPMPEGVRFTPLLYSSQKSWLAPSSAYSVAPNDIPTPKPTDPHGPYVLGGVLEGTFPSYFAGKPSPVKGAAPAILKSKPTAIFVLGTSHILNPQLPEFRGVDALVTNALAYLAKDETLIGIQAKGNIVRPLRPVLGPLREVVKYGVILGVAFLPALWGLLRWRRRMAWRRTIAAGFAPAPVVPAAQ